MRLALAAVRHADLQPESLGGRGVLDKIFDDQGNQMLMQAALWDLSRSGPKSFTLRDWFRQLPGNVKQLTQLPPTGSSVEGEAGP